MPFGILGESKTKYPLYTIARLGFEYAVFPSSLILRSILYFECVCLFVPTVCDEDTTKIQRCRWRVYSKSAIVEKVYQWKDSKSFRNNFVLCSTQRETMIKIFQMRVPFEGTDLSLIARSWTRGSTRVSGEVARENKGIYREIKMSRNFFRLSKHSSAKLPYSM